MKIKCEYCGSMMEDTLEKCPNCGAVNTNVKRMTDTTPQTIEELQGWYEARNLPPYETTRFFLGIDHQGPKAIGIYKKDGEFIVYKNKADGTRAIRYQGTDEAYAVNEVYLKLKATILDQKAQNAAGRSASTRGTTVSSSRGRGSAPRNYSPDYGYTPLRDSKGKKILLGIFIFLGLGIFAYLEAKAFYVVGVFILLALAYFGISKLISGVFHVKSDWLFTGKRDLMRFGKQSILLYGLTLAIGMYGVGVYDTPKYYSPASGDSIFVSYHDDWYEYRPEYDDYFSIDEEALPMEIQEHPADYEFDWYDSEWNTSFTEFRDSQTYQNTYENDSDYGSGSGSSYNSGSNYDYDHDYDWDAGNDNWDNDNFDWDSDW